MNDVVMDKKLDRIDKVAVFLLTATTVVTAVWTAAGLGADRFPALLNSSGVKGYLIAAFATALVAVAMGAAAQGPWGQAPLKTIFLVIGLVALIASMGFVVWSTAFAFTEDGRPRVADVAVSTPSGTTADATFTVRAEGVDRHTHLLIIASWVRNGPNDPQRPPVFSSIVRPDPSGIVEQKVTMALSRQAAPTFVRLQAYRIPDKVTVSLEEIPPGADCSRQEDQKTAAACLTLLIPGTEATPAAGG